MANSTLEHLIQDFSTDGIIKFFRERSSKFAPRKEALGDYNDDLFKDGIKLGEIKFDETEELIVCAFKCDATLSERSGKKAQYEKAKMILKERVCDSGIFIFNDKVGNFRFSLVYTNYQGIKKEWSSFKRLTYFVSKELTNKTFLQSIGEADFSTLEKIQGAFSVEKVTDNFFKKFRVIFDETKEAFECANKNTVCLWLRSHYQEAEYQEQIRKFTFTFLGRIIFIYFLLRKGWIENQRDFIRKYIESDQNNNLYLNFFEPLFFDVFATKELDRKPNIKKLYPTTKYLNGGLFERSDLEDEMKKSGKFILFEDEFIKRIILDFFEAYNFTVDENSLDDQEVSIDPEMLGKVFENTLAEELKTKRGTFYTPRDIVQFMVKESLLQFLINETSVDPKKLQTFVYIPDSNLDLFNKEEIRTIDSKLESLKILDPAVGSAAFPVEMMRVLVFLRRKLSVKVGSNISEVSLKKEFIKNNLYGVDIDPAAIEISKLRLWLSLVVDYELEDAEPLPNLDFQFRVGNSLQEKIGDIDIFHETGLGPKDLFSSQTEYEKMKNRMIAIKDQSYLPHNEGERHRLKNEFDELEHKMIQEVLNKYEEKYLDQSINLTIGKTSKMIKVTKAQLESLKQKIKDGTYKLFKPDFHFSEVFDRKKENGEPTGGFDIVIGNPPYGVDVEEDIKILHDLDSKDTYGVFISTALKRFLKPGGVLAFIVSDTWLTIKSHRALRSQVINKQVHKIIRLNQDCFDATVNVCILTLSNRSNLGSYLIAADLTNLHTRNKHNELQEILNNLGKYIGMTNNRFAIYRYVQDVIRSNTSLPFFVCSPKIFMLMNDQTCHTSIELLNDKKIETRSIEINDKPIVIVPLEQIAAVRHGLTTGDTKRFIYRKGSSIGGYKLAKAELILHENEWSLLDDEERKNGFIDGKFGPKFLLPYDKGGDSDADSKWLPKYYIETEYFIDWRKSTVDQMKKLPGFRHDGNQFYFVHGITFSHTGIYSPTFRLSSGTIFDTAGSCLFLDLFSKEYLLGILNSKLILYIFKNIINHTVNASENPIKLIPIGINEDTHIVNKVNSIIEKQKNFPKYDYINSEQMEIDHLVYKMYGLNEEDIREVETWYARRYPKLVKF